MAATADQQQQMLRQDSAHDAGAAQALLDAQQATHAASPSHVSSNKRQRSSPSTGVATPRSSGATADVESYFQARNQIFEAEASLAFDHRCRVRATPLEQTVDGILMKLRELDQRNVYDAAEARIGHGGQRHRRFAGDHFLSNVDLIGQTALFDVAQHMPKGAHLHIHFNACLPPAVLLGIAKGMDRMFITSDLPLVEDKDCENFVRCEIQFSLLSVDREADAPGDLFSPEYKPRQTMRFDRFLEQFPRHYSAADAETWLLNKLVFSENEAHGLLQTAAG